MQSITKSCFKILPLSGHALKIRFVSALFISGDKASENTVTLQPYMDFQNSFQNIEQLEHSIEKRKLSVDLRMVAEMFRIYKNEVKAMANLEDEREMIAKQLKELSKSTQKDEDLLNQLKEKGKKLRNELKSMKTNFYHIEENFVQTFLDLPNTLHKHCPVHDHEKLLYRSHIMELEGQKSHLDYENLINFIENSRYYMLNEAAEFDIRCPQALTRYFLDNGGFIQTANPDFTRRVLLEANATPVDHYHKVVEAHLKNKINAAYLTGGGSFESFLGAVTKLCVYPNVLPLKFVSCGRLYERTHTNNTHSLFTATQNNAVQTFVAASDLVEAEEQMENILNLCLDFYKTFNINFRIVYVNAAHLMPAESLRAQIEIYSPYEKRYICVGKVSNYKDFVSKRILFTMRQQKNHHFLYIVGGPLLYTSRLIAALIEHGETLDYENILEKLKIKTSPGDATTNALNEFKSIFE